MTSKATSLAAEIRDRGWRAAALAGLTHARLLLSVDESHTWSELSLVGYRHGEEPDACRRPDGPGPRLLYGSTEHLPMIDRLPTVGSAVAARRLQEGARWWLLVDGDEPVFSCWTFSRVMRMIGAPAGTLLLPPDVMFLEDSVTNPQRRGAGASQVALTAVCRLLGEEGFRWILTKVKVGDTAPERMVAKVGFVPMATVRIWRRGTVHRTWAVLTSEAANTWLPGALGAENQLALQNGYRPNGSLADMTTSPTPVRPSAGVSTESER
jgi:hypothetical protein